MAPRVDVKFDSFDEVVQRMVDAANSTRRMMPQRSQSPFAAYDFFSPSDHLRTIYDAFIHQPTPDVIEQPTFDAVFIDLATRHTQWPGLISDESSYDKEMAYIRHRGREAERDMQRVDFDKELVLDSIIRACINRLRALYGYLKQRTDGSGGDGASRGSDRIRL